MKLSWIIWFLPPTSLWGCPWQKQHASSFAAFAAFAAAFGFRTCSTTARTLPWIRGEGFCRTCCKWEASTFIAIAVFHPFFMCFFPQGGLVPSGFTLYLQVFRLEQVADFDGQVQRLNDSMCVFFLGWEPRLELWKTPGTWSASWFRSGRLSAVFCAWKNGTSWREMSGQSPTDPRAADVVKLTECWWLFKAAGTVCFKLPGWSLVMMSELRFPRRFLGFFVTVPRRQIVEPV